MTGSPAVLLPTGAGVTAGDELETSTGREASCAVRGALDVRAKLHNKPRAKVRLLKSSDGDRRSPAMTRIIRYTRGEDGADSTCNGIRKSTIIRCLGGTSREDALRRRPSAAAGGAFWG